MAATGNEEESMIVRALRAIASASETKGADMEVLPQDSISNWHASATADCAIFSYKQDFCYLWGLVATRGFAEIAQSLAELRGNKAKPYTLIIVWDGVRGSDELIDVSRYVTPYDWSVALSFAIYDACKGKPWRPRLRILILDVNIQQTEKGFMKESLFVFHNVLPWIQDYRLFGNPDEWLAKDVIDDTDWEVYSLLRQALPLNRQGAEHLIQDILQPRNVLTTFTNDDRSVYFDVIRESWRQHFLKPGGRHVVANLLGPIVLAAGLPEKIRTRAVALIEEASLWRRALAVVVQGLGLLCLDSGKAKDIGAVNLSDNDGFGWRKGVRFLLLDDQFRLGYHHIVAFVLFGENYRHENWQSVQRDCSYTDAVARISCTPTADSLFLTLEKLEKVTNWALPRKLDIPECDVLLLDLRLWSDDVEARSKFMERLVAVCRHLGAQRLDDQKFQTAFVAAERLAKGNSGEEIPALGLLAMLISYYDPSLPIILFSSTHQRDVVDLVAHRPNIITSFAKPLFMGYGEEQKPDGLVRGLVAAIRRAVDLHEARIVWERITTVDWTRNNPIFGADSGGVGNGAFIRYNVFPNDPTYAPRMYGDGLKIAFAEYYFRYLVGDSHFDFASVPFEFFEGALTPDQPPDLRFAWLVADYCMRAAPLQVRRNKFGQALKTIRNRKVHGYASPPYSKTERESWRLATILEFLALLDYVEERAYLEAGLKDRLETLLISCYSALPAARNLESAAATRDLQWLKFVAIAVLQGIVGSCDENDQVRASQTTVRAVERLLAEFVPV